MWSVSTKKYIRCWNQHKIGGIKKWNGLYLLGKLEADVQGDVKKIDHKINDLRTSKPVFFYVKII